MISGRADGQKPGFFPKYFVTARSLDKNPVSLA
jgi:hypothetical protein